jgi:uroporphyrinogen decarboxylase
MTMTHRERVLSALNHQEPDRVPLDLGTIATRIRVEAYERLKEYLQLNSASLFDSHRTVAHLDETLLQYFDIDTRLLEVQGPDSRRSKLSNGRYIDGWGITWKGTEGQAAIVEKGPFSSRELSIQDLIRYNWPNPDDPELIGDLSNRAQKLHNESDYAIVMRFSARIFTLGQFMCGFIEWMGKLLKDQAFAAQLMDIGTEIQIAIAARMLEAVGNNVDVIYCAEDLGMQTGPMISPDLYRKLVKPRHKRIFEYVKSKSNAKLVLHSDGGIEPLISDMIDMGVDAINPVQASARGMDTKDLKKKYGNNMSYWGSIDTQRVLPFGSPEDVRMEVRRRIDDLAQGGGYVLGPCHNIQAEVSPENICTMYEEARRYGQYPLTHDEL